MSAQTLAVQNMVAEINKKTAAARRNVFAKKATDQQHHLNLFKHVEVFLEAFRLDPRSNNSKESLRELSMAMTLSRRKLQP